MLGEDIGVVISYWPSPLTVASLYIRADTHARAKGGEYGRDESGGCGRDEYGKCGGDKALNAGAGE